MIQRNIALMPRVWRITSSSIGQESRPRHQAAIVETSAPTALDSVRLVMPVRKRPVIDRKMTSGVRP